MILGIDISKAYFDVTLVTPSGAKQHRQFTNDEPGITALLTWLKRQGVSELHACMEATNLYWEAVAERLQAQGNSVSVVNPARIKGFAQSQLRRNKTDKQDSEVIADFCTAMRPAAWQPPSPLQRKLRALERHREALQKTLTQQKNRLASSKDPDVIRSLQKVIDLLQQEIEQIDQQITDQIESHEELATQKALLLSIQGIGERTAHKLMTELYDLAQYTSAHAAAADAGVTPAHHESGASVRRTPKISKVGKASVRSILYWPAITAIRYNPVVRALAERLRARHKPEKLIIAAAMRKLMHLAYGVLKNQMPFDPNYASATPVPT
jgi:transposase